MNIIFNQEEPHDYKAVFNLIKEAFKTEELSEHNEHFLVENLRKSDAFIPELSIIAKVNNKIVGHILLTKIKIKHSTAQFDSLALAPVSVLPNFQNKGIGGKLILHAHQKAKELGYSSIILLGHKDYYPRFGYQRADKFGIQLPFEVPKENVMAIELIPNGLKGISGVVHYPKPFYES